MTYKVLIILLGIFLFTQVGAAQDESPYVRGLLYRDGDQLMFVNPYADNPVAEPFPLEIAASEADINWSPDGRFLTVIDDDDCFNLYDVDTQNWVSEEPIACDIREFRFSNDNTQIAYSTIEYRPGHEYSDFVGHLWIYDIEHRNARQVGSTDEGALVRTGFNRISWSPSDAYLVYARFDEIMGGSVNVGEVMDVETGTAYTVGGDYYASFDLVWSPNEEWFLVIIREEYVGNWRFPSNHRGDLYLVRSEDGEQFRLTYTPADAETNLYWLDDGTITFDTVEHVNLTIDEATEIVSPPRESIIYPEDTSPVIEPDGYPSPDDEFLVRYMDGDMFLDEDHDYLMILQHKEDVFSIPLPLTNRDEFWNAIIGWRPQPTEQPTSSDE